MKPVFHTDLAYLWKFEIPSNSIQTPTTLQIAYCPIWFWPCDAAACVMKCIVVLYALMNRMRYFCPNTKSFRYSHIVLICAFSTTSQNIRVLVRCMNARPLDCSATSSNILCSRPHTPKLSSPPSHIPHPCASHARNGIEMDFDYERGKGTIGASNDAQDFKWTSMMWMDSGKMRFMMRSKCGKCFESSNQQTNAIRTEFTWNFGE